MIRKAFLGMAAAAAVAAAAPASAVIVTFAQFAPVGQDANLRWVNSGPGNLGTGGRFYTTATATGTAPGNAAVTFKFLSPQLVGIGDIEANFFMDITVASGNPATAMNAFRIQDVPTGSFSFISTQAFQVGNVNYGIGTNLLAGTFGSGTIFGTASSGSFSGNSVDGTLSYSSAVLGFGNTNDRDYSMSLTSVTPVFFREVTQTSVGALRSFRAFAGGSFSSNPAPLVNAVPEPHIWIMLIVGFGLVGVQSRRRARNTVTA